MERNAESRLLDADAVNLSFLAREVEASEKYYRASVSRNRISRLVLQLYMLAGVMAAIGGAVYAILQVWDIRLPSGAIAGILVSMSGLMFAVASWSMARYLAEKDKLANLRTDSVGDYRSLLWNWVRFESLSRELLDGDSAGNVRPVTIRQIIDGLIAKGVIDDIEARIVRDALEARNRIVHGFKVTDIEIMALKFLPEVTSKLAPIVMTDTVRLK